MNSIDPMYALGVEEMDAQHAVWLRLIAEFRAAAAGVLEGPEAVTAAARALDRLLDYTKSHFASEEALLAASHYPGLEAHRQQHREVREVVERLRGELRERGGRLTPLKLNLFASVWLLEHILREDGKCARFILGQATDHGGKPADPR